MEVQIQSFKTIETKALKIEIYNASENSFGVASVIVSGETDAVLIDAQFTIVDAEKVAHEIMQTIKDGSVIFCYYPDKNWLQGSDLLNSSL